MRQPVTQTANVKDNANKKKDNLKQKVRTHKTRDSKITDLGYQNQAYGVNLSNFYIVYNTQNAFVQKCQIVFFSKTRIFIFLENQVCVSMSKLD
jgi:hypothetical protein